MGHTVSQGKIPSHQANVAAIAEATRPHSKKDV